MDNLSQIEQKRRKLILQIQELHKLGTSIPEIIQITGKDRKTIKKYLEGDPDKLCHSNAHGSLEKYTSFIIENIQNGFTQSAIARKLAEQGYAGTLANARQYICKVAAENNLEIRKYCNSSAKYNADGSKKTEIAYITRKGIFNYLWMNGELPQTHRKFLWKQMPFLWELEQCIKEFRMLFTKKSLALL